jgi:acyl-homoserine lactone synthase
MLYMVKGWDEKYQHELDLAFRFRHAAFVEEAGWENLRRADGREIDQFDTDDTIHVVVINSEGVQAYSRLNPTLKPHVLSEVYPQLASRGLPRDEGAWEWSRMGTAKQARNEGYGWNSAIGLLLRCVSYVAIKNDISSLIWQAHPVWISRAFELGFNPEPLGLPQRIHGERVIAAKMDVEPHVFHAMDDLDVPRTELHSSADSRFAYFVALERDVAIKGPELRQETGLF